VPVHGGTVNKTGLPKLTVNGSPVLGGSGINGDTITGCKTVTNAMAGNKQCLNVTSVLPISFATKLKVSGEPVALETLLGATNGTVAGLPQALAANAMQTKLTAV
jgi:hypothetical protein